MSKPATNEQIDDIESWASCQDRNQEPHRTNYISLIARIWQEEENREASYVLMRIADESARIHEAENERLRAANVAILNFVPEDKAKEAYDASCTAMAAESSKGES